MHVSACLCACVLRARAVCVSASFLVLDTPPWRSSATAFRATRLCLCPGPSLWSLRDGDGSGFGLECRPWPKRPLAHTFRGTGKLACENARDSTSNHFFSGGHALQRETEGRTRACSLIAKASFPDLTWDNVHVHFACNCSCNCSGLALARARHSAIYESTNLSADGCARCSTDAACAGRLYPPGCSSRVVWLVLVGWFGWAAGTPWGRRA